jgi:hypothetical protein
MAPTLDEAPSFVERMFDGGLDFFIGMAEFHVFYALQIYVLAR